MVSTHQQLDALCSSTEPSIRYKARVGVLGESESSRGIRALRKEIRRSPRIATLLAGRASDGRLLRGRHVYAKWQGAHWVMAALADLGYPPGDRQLIPIRDQLLDAWLGPQFFDEWECPSKAKAYTRSGVPVMRGLAAYARHSGAATVHAAVEGAASVFLDRHLFKRRSNGATIRGEFVKLHYPLYWHYDILGGLKVLNEAGLIRDRRCGAALDLLAAKQLADGGFPAEARHYKTSRKLALGADAVDWGGTSKRVANSWVTADALAVLTAAGRT